MSFTDILVRSRLEEGRARIDHRLPLGLRIGAKVRLPVGSWVLYKNRFLMKKPCKEGVVRFFSRTQIEGFSYYRFYIGTEERTEAILQARMYAGDVTECIVFTPFGGLSFGSEIEWDKWLGDNGRLGRSEYQNDGTTVTFQRMWGNPDKDWVEAPIYIEELTCGAFEGDPILTVGCQGMLFGRWVKEDVCAEYLLAEFQEGKNRSEITIRLGFEVPAQAIKVYPAE